MREIKFRAWDGLTKKNTNYQICDDMVLFFDKHKGCWLKNQKDRFVLIQYTGLKDENGVEIYQGDIVRTFGESFVVFYSQEQVGYLLKDIDGCLETIRSYRVEVLGNIYENPELLEER